MWMNSINWLPCTQILVGFWRFSNPMPEDKWTGAVGFIHEVLFEQYLRDHEAPEDCEYYMCGPPMMIAAVERLLEDLGVEEENVLFDDFGN